MNSKLSLIVLLIFLGQNAAVWCQTTPDKSIIEHVVLETDPNPRFIRLIVEAVIPLGGHVTDDDDVACAKSELLRTGLFKKVDSRLYKLQASNHYDLIFTTEFESRTPVYRLSKLDVTGVEGVDHSEFAKLLQTKGLVGRQLSLATADYADFVDKVFDLLKQSIRDETKREWSSPAWIELELNANRELEVTVKPDFNGCSSAAESQGGGR